jgi:hypothetical protein
LQSGYNPQTSDPPFLLELAHYEWVDVALKTSDVQIPWEQIDSRGDLLKGAPVVSPLAWSLAYHFPVHKISSEFQPDKPDDEPTRILVYRSLADVVGFIEMNVVTARLLELADDNPENKSGRELLLQIAVELGHPDAEAVVSGGEEILSRLRRKDVLLGTRR